DQHPASRVRNPTASQLTDMRHVGMERAEFTLVEIMEDLPRQAVVDEARSSRLYAKRRREQFTWCYHARWTKPLLP
ncbi:hypothetical protein, partial [Methylacidiphilum caldifontis]|uniref:hypothetical protein n=1 Tax=Methylacidiphilum caldifontis TaxID=2795386 RepID=UPI001ABC2B2D